MILKMLTFILITLFSILNYFCNYSSVVSIIISSLMVSMVYGYLVFSNRFQFHKKSVVILSILISFFICYLCSGRIMKTYPYQKIEIKNISSSPIVLDAIYLDDQKQKLNHVYDKNFDLIHDASFKTEYKIQNKNTSLYKATLVPNDVYILNVDKRKKIEIQFQRKKTNYFVSVNHKKQKVPSFEYDNLSKKAIQMGNYNTKYLCYNQKSYSRGLSSILFLLFWIGNFLLVNLCFNERKFQSLFLLVCLLEWSPHGNLPIIFRGFLYLLLFWIFRKYKTEFTLNRKYRILFFISSLYISFSILGSFLIHDFSFNCFLYYSLLSFFFYRLFPLLMVMLDSFCKRVQRKNRVVTNQLIFHRILIFCIPVIILFIYQQLFYPYIYLADSTMQMQDIINHTLSNWHPYFHTFLLSLFYQVFGNLNWFICFRILVYSALLNQILFYLHKRGMKLIWIYFIVFFFNLMPTTGVIMVTLLKDVDFVLALVALSFYMYLLMLDFSTFHQYKWNYLFLFLSLIGVGFFRHNGIFVSILISILLLIFFIKTKNWLVGVITMVFLISVFVIQGPLYQILKVKDAPKNFNMATMIHGLGYIMVEDRFEFSKDTYRYLTRNVLSEKEFRWYYDPFNIDILLHYNHHDEKRIIRNLDLSQGKIVQIYLKQVLKSPIYLLKDRLYGTDVIWNVIEDDHIDILKYQTLYDEFDRNYKQEEMLNSRHSRLITGILNFISSNYLLNILCFRVGVYLDLLIIFINYWMLKKRKKVLVLLLPLFINLITLLLAMHYQAFRYVWMVPVITFLFILITVFEQNTQDFVDKY